MAALKENNNRKVMFVHNQGKEKRTLQLHTLKAGQRMSHPANGNFFKS